MDNEIVVKKRCPFLTALKVILVLAAVSFAAYKIYQKFFKKKKTALPDAEEADTLTEGAESCSACEEEASFEAAAQDVIANPESMEG